MKIFHHLRKAFITLMMVVLLVTTTACGTVAQDNRVGYQPGIEQGTNYDALARGDTAQGSNFGNWVVQTSRGLIRDAYVRDNDKLGVVITPQVRPNEVKNLARALVQGFHKNAPNRDLTVLVYAPDKELVLTARYNNQTHQVEYSS